MEKLKLEINNKLEVFYDKKNYKSVIQDIREKEKEVLISIPVFDGEYLTLATGTIIEQIYYDNNGNVYQFKSKVLGRIKERNLSLYRLSSPYDIKKIQRRDYVRVNFVKAINYLHSNNIEEKYKKALLLDLSGGGMKMKVEEKLEKGDVIFSKIIYEDSIINVNGKVVRVERTDDNKFICGINFSDISEKTREEIIKIVFKVMRKQRELI
ncbi:flagellar brake protein [Clostridium isatidis]|uniref:Pilus assembly protein PilZ n=1 Tax=Clostridium isatidis TaxID=182773 RepID=A0A343JC23_9CLOT|nr:flagellar brake domain-containing protein [Clostridium isatidis]ASW43081.1 pilus assembly protein PilZ [Clostridium isatidis]